MHKAAKAYVCREQTARQAEVKNVHCFLLLSRPSFIRFSFCCLPSPLQLDQDVSIKFFCVLSFFRVIYAFSFLPPSRLTKTLPSSLLCAFFFLRGHQVCCVLFFSSELFMLFLPFSMTKTLPSSLLCAFFSRVIYAFSFLPPSRLTKTLPSSLLCAFFFSQRPSSLLCAFFFSQSYLCFFFPSAWPRLCHQVCCVLFFSELFMLFPSFPPPSRLTKT